MTMKSSFFPVIGDKIFGWMGDLIDTVTVAVTLFGVCTSLGLCVIFLESGARAAHAVPCVPVATSI
jgi:choline-glycine betaine transporter